MEEWSTRGDGHYLRPRRASYSLLAGFLAIALGLASLGYFHHFGDQDSLQPPAPHSAASEPAPQSSTPAPAAASHPLDLRPLEPGLPTLENSDSSMRGALAGLMGDRAFAEFVVPDLLIRRFVATIDNLPRPTAPRRMMPLSPVPGAFAIVLDTSGAIIDAANSARYAPHVRVMEAVNSGALVSMYVRTYSLFQRAYEELGYPGQHFNDRLVAAIDDMLAAPEPAGPLEVVQGRILYEFADPDLDTRSAGQKILLRMGRENAIRVKSKLVEIRQELIAASRRRP